MPKEIEDQLIRKARARGWVKKKKGKTILTDKGRAYVYGTLQKITDWKPGKK